MNQKEKAVIDAAINYVDSDGSSTATNVLLKAVSDYKELEPFRIKVSYYSNTYPTWWGHSIDQLRSMHESKIHLAKKWGLNSPPWRDLIHATLVIEQILLLKKEIENESGAHPESPK